MPKQDKCMICGAPTLPGDYSCRGECARKARSHLHQLQHYSEMFEALAAEALRAGDVVMHGAHTEASRVYAKLVGVFVMDRVADRQAAEVGACRECRSTGGHHKMDCSKR